MSGSLNKDELVELLDELSERLKRKKARASIFDPERHRSPSPAAQGLDPPNGFEAELPRLRQRQHRIE